MKARMSVIITNYNTHEFVRFLLKTLIELSTEIPIIYIHDNGSTPSNFKKLLKIINQIKETKIILISTIDRSRSSVAHGNALDRSIRLVDTEYYCIFDSDCVPLCRGWDDILIKKLNSGISIIGSPYWSGDTATHKKYNDFPAQFFVAFRTKDYLAANTTCQAYDTAESDTCMQWKGDFQDAELQSEVFKVANTRQVKIENVSPVICTCYFLDGQLIGSHFGRGHQGGRPKYNGIHSVFSGFSMVFKLPFVGNIFISLKAKSEFYTWRSKLTAIINMER